MPSVLQASLNAAALQSQATQTASRSNTGNSRSEQPNEATSSNRGEAAVTNLTIDVNSAGAAETSNDAVSTSRAGEIERNGAQERLSARPPVNASTPDVSQVNEEVQTLGLNSGPQTPRSSDVSSGSRESAVLGAFANGQSSDVNPVGGAASVNSVAGGLTSPGFATGIGFGASGGFSESGEPGGASGRDGGSAGVGGIGGTDIVFSERSEDALATKG